MQIHLCCNAVLALNNSWLIQSTTIKPFQNKKSRRAALQSTLWNNIYKTHMYQNVWVIPNCCFAVSVPFDSLWVVCMRVCVPDWQVSQPITFIMCHHVAVAVATCKVISHQNCLSDGCKASETASPHTPVTLWDPPSISHTQAVWR